MCRILLQGARIFVLLLVSFSTSNAQKEIIHQSLYWIRYYSILNFNPKWSWHNEIDTRHFFVNSRQHQLIIHSRASYRLTDDWTVAAALTYSAQKPQIPDPSPRPVTPEFRLWQEAAYNQVLSNRFALNYRIRIEERFLSTHPGPFDFDEPHPFVFRHRYRAQLGFAIKEANLAFRASNELFLNNFQGTLFDQNRVYLSVEKRFNPAFAVEVGYMNIFQRTRTPGLYFQRNNLRLTLLHTLRPL
jgi:hypothetical protein